MNNSRGADGSVIINTRVNTNGMEDGMHRVQSQVSNLGSSLKKLGGIIASVFAVRQIVQFARECIELGSDLDEVQNVVDVTFGKMADSINEFAKSAADQFGLSELAAKQYTSTLGAMYKSMGFTEEAAAGMAAEMTGLAADMASFYNLSTDTAFNKLRSGIAGETEPLKQLGINLSEANLEEFRLAQGISVAYKNMDQQSKALLRYNYILSVTSDAQGDFSRTSNSWANQTRILSLRMQELKANLGKGLVNVLTPTLRVINKLLAALTRLAAAFRAFTELITGGSGQASTGDTSGAMADTSDAYEDTTDSAEDYASATDDVADATKKLNKQNDRYLSNLDDIHRFQTSISDSDTGTGSGSKDTGKNANAGLTPSEVFDFGKLAKGETVVDQLDARLQALIATLKRAGELFHEGFKVGMGGIDLEPLKNALIGIGSTLKDIITDDQVVSAANRFVETFIWSIGARVGAFASIGISMATNIAGGLEQALSSNKERIIDWIASMFDIGSRVETIKANYAIAIADIFSVIGGENGQAVTANIIGIFANAFMGATQLAASFMTDMVDALTRPFIENKDAIKAALDGILGVFAGVLGSIQILVKGVVDKALSVYNDHLAPLLQSVGNGLSSLVGTAMELWNKYVLPVLEDIGKKLEFTINNYVLPLVSTVLSVLGQVCDLVKVLWETVLVPTFEWIMQTVAPVLAPLITFIADSFMASWQLIMTALNTFLIVAGGIIDFLTKVFQGDWKGAWEAIKKAAIAAWARLQTGVQAPFNAIKLKIENVWDAVQTKTGEVWGFISSALGGSWEGIKKNAGIWFERIKTTIGTVWTNIQTAAGLVWGTITSALRTTWETIKTTATEKFNAVKANVYNAWSFLKTKAETIWSNIKDFIVTPLQTIWDKAVEVGAGIKDAFVGAFTGLSDLLKTPINAVIGAVNWLIDSINSAIGNIESVFSFGFTFTNPFTGASQHVGYTATFPRVPRIPELALGAVIPPNAPFMAMLGDQKHGTNIEAPLETIKQAVSEVTGSRSGQIHVHVYLKGRQIYEAVIDEAKAQRQMSGRNPFEFA